MRLNESCGNKIIINKNQCLRIEILIQVVNGLESDSNVKCVDDSPLCGVVKQEQTSTARSQDTPYSGEAADHSGRTAVSGYQERSTDEAKKNGENKNGGKTNKNVNLNAQNIGLHNVQDIGPNGKKINEIVQENSNTNLVGPIVEPDNKAALTLQLPNMTRCDIKEYIWKTLPELSLALKPIPCENRNPNFKGVKDAIKLFAKLDIYKNAKLLRVSCDKVMEHFRIKAIRDNKQLVYSARNLTVPVFMTAKGNDNAYRSMNRKAVLCRFINRPINPFDPSTVSTIDIYAVSSVAVDVTGRWIGTYQDINNLEFIALRELGLISIKTTIVTFVSDHQVFEKVQDTEFNDLDLPLDIIVTPSQIIIVTKPHPRPSINSLHIRAEEKAFITKIIKYFKNKKTLKI